MTSKLKSSVIPLFLIISCAFLKRYLQGTAYLPQKRMDLRKLQAELKIENGQVLIKITKLKSEIENLI